VIPFKLLDDRCALATKFPGSPLGLELSTKRLKNFQGVNNPNRAPISVIQSIYICFLPDSSGKSTGNSWGNSEKVKFE